MTSEEKIRLLAQKLALLSSNIDKQKSEIDAIKAQINQLLSTLNNEKIVGEIREITKSIEPDLKKEIIDVPEVKKIEIKDDTKENPEVKIVADEPEFKKEEPVPFQQQSPVLKSLPDPVKVTATNNSNNVKPSGFNLEKYIGVKLAGIIGIILLVIGLSMLVKYAIDNDLLNPLTRVVLGFASGGLLLTFAFILKRKYHIFSAIILGGAVSVLFFSSFAGHAFYDLYPKLFAFGLMFIITAFTVFAAHSYNYEVIAVIGLVGAYAIPPLLSDGSGKIAYMFTYMAIINGGILVLSLFKNWNWVKYFAYGLTWLIAGSWIGFKYDGSQTIMALSFISVFYVTFYLSFIGYKILKKIPFNVMDIITLLSNSFAYFGFGYYCLNYQGSSQYLGLFCVFNALLNAAIAYACYIRKVNDKNILYFVLALVLTYVTIAVPVQLEGAVVTLSWFAEMFMLYFIGRKFNVNFFKQIAYGVSVLGFFSLWHDWGTNYVAEWESSKVLMKGFLNKTFMTSVFAAGFMGGFWFLLIRQKSNDPNETTHDVFAPAMKIMAPVLFFIIFYFTFFFEIIHHFQAWMTTTAIKSGLSELYNVTEDKSLPVFMMEWLLIYTGVFSSVIFYLNAKFFNTKALYWVFYSMGIFSILILMPAGLAGLGELRKYFNSTDEDYFPSQFRTPWLINFRYVFIAFAVFINLVMYFAQLKKEYKLSRNIFIWILHLGIITLLSSELVHQFRISHPEDAIMYDKIARRMGFTILWALYSLGLIIAGIAGKKRMMRIMGFTLFGAALVKLFINSFNMSGGYKIIVWISLGVIFMVIGFLYQRFKHILFEDDEEVGK